MITTVRIQRFKAIADARIVFQDINAFVGNNGSGKSSVIEALQTLQLALTEGLDQAFNGRWLGMDNVRNAAAAPTDDICIELEGTIAGAAYHYAVCFNSDSERKLYLVTRESLSHNGQPVFEAMGDRLGNGTLVQGSQPATSYQSTRMVLGDSRLCDTSFALDLAAYIRSWQFLSLEPERMYMPSRRDYSQRQVSLQSSGENLADLFSRTQDDLVAFESILDKMRYVLPDLADFGREEISVQKLIYLFLTEGHHDRRLPSWMFSSGTLRVLAILTLLNQATVPPVVFIEELENGLDPRTLNLLVEEMRSLIPETQFVLTTHSPYLLDLLALRHIVMTERHAGETVYFRPDDDERLTAWKEEFSAGKLYLMDKFQKP